MLTAAAAAAAAVLHCGVVIPGAEALLQEGASRYLVVGELHGSREGPRLFGDLVCQAAQARRHVLVALERDTTEQPALDAYLASPGDAAAKARLIQESGWDVQDGRSSQAWLDLIERLRRMRQAGLIDGVVAFRDMTRPVAVGGDVNVAVNKAMADALMAAVRAPDELVIVLTGLAHAYRPGPHETVDFVPAAALLPADATRSLAIEADGGSSWNCQASGCAAHPLEGHGKHPAGLVLNPALEAGFDGVLYVGGPATPSPPARRHAP